MSELNDFLSGLSSLLLIMLILLAVGTGFYLARQWRVRNLRRRVRGQIPLTDEIKQTVSRLFASDTLEVAALGAVTYVDIAWQYSLADPQLWTHLDGGAATHAFDTILDPQMLKAGLGEQAQPILGHVADYLQQVEALQSFDHSLDSVMRLGVDLPNAVLLLDGHPDPLFDILHQEGLVTSGPTEAKAHALADKSANVAVDAKAGALADAKASTLADAKVSTLVESKATSLADAKASALAEAKTTPLVDAKASSILDGIWDGGDLWHYVPIITISFATYRAWRRAESGTRWTRNLEFAATEVITRSGGALAGAKVGGTLGTLAVPGYGTVIGSVAGAVGGVVAGARLGEEIKRRHVRQAQRDLDKALHHLGAPHLQDPVGYRLLRDAFLEQEKAAKRNAEGTRSNYRAYARPWRRLWPDQKLMLLQETVRESDERLLTIHQQVRDTLDRVDVLHQQNNYKALGLILWNAPGMCQRLGCAELLLRDVNRANNRLRGELAQVGASPN